MAGAASYKAILVYDVSRRGRFQDTDESAHYEFLCKGVREANGATDQACTKEQCERGVGSAE